MTDQALESPEELEEGAEEEGADGAEGTPPQRLSRKKLLLYFVLPVVLVIGAAVGVYFSGAADSLLGGEEKSAAVVEQEKLEEQRAQAVFLDLPELLVNLNSSGRRTNFLKISISLEVANEADLRRLETLMPRIIDSFQVYLRELRVSDLKGSAGIYRLREDLLRRVNEAARPVKINDVLFKEMLVQ